MRSMRILAATALALSLAACGDSGDSKTGGGGDAPAPAAAMSTADCKDAGSAMSYLDQRQKKLMDDVKANKAGIGETFNAFLAVVQAEADKAKAGGNWADYCKAIDAHLTGAGY